MKGFEDGPNKTRIALELLGARGGQALMPLMDRGSAAMITFKQHIEELGLGLSDLQINRLAHLHEMQAELGLQWEGLVVSLVVRLLPTIENLIKDFGYLLEKLREMGSWKPPAWLGVLSMSFDDIGKAAVAWANAANMSPAQLVARDAAHNNPLAGSSIHGANNPLNVWTGSDGNPIDDMVGWRPDAPGKAKPLTADQLRKQQEAAMAAAALPFTMGPQQPTDTQNLRALIGDMKDLSDAFKNGDASVVALSRASQQMLDNFAHNTSMFKALGNVSRAGTDATVSGVHAMVQNVTSGLMTIGQGFDGLISGIVQKLEQSAAEQGIGLLLGVIGTATGQPWLTAIGGAISAGGGGGGAKNGSASQTIINVNALSAKDVLRSLTSPTGELNAATRALNYSARMP